MRYTFAPKRKSPLKERYLWGFNNEYVLPYTPSSAIQVLEPVTSRDNIERDEAGNFEREWGFGGGRSGLSVEEMEILNTCFKFRYMGASEYEGGNIKRSLDIIMATVLIPFELDIFGYKVWVIGFSCHKPYIQRSLEAWIVNNQFHRYRLHKEPFYLDKTIKHPIKEKLTGLWDTKNNFIVFTHKGTFKRFKRALIDLKQLPTAVEMVDNRVDLIRLIQNKKQNK